MVCRGGGKADQLALDEHRHDEGDVGAVAGARVGVVVHEHIAWPELIAALGQDS
jgi:hypothetical protein